MSLSVLSEVETALHIQMAEPRKVQFVTLSAFAAGPATESRKRRLDDEADTNFDGDVGIGKSVPSTGGGGGLFGKTSDRDSVEPNRATVRLNLSLTEPNDQTSAEFNYSELIQSLQVRTCLVLDNLKRICVLSWQNSH